MSRGAIVRFCPICSSGRNAAAATVPRENTPNVRAKAQGLKLILTEAS